MAYPETKRYLESLANYEKYKSYPYEESLDPERIKGFLDVLGDPQRGLRCIHIAGTKGKGSTAVFIAYILREAGFRVGLYTSPHLSDFRERIRILEPYRAGVQEHPPAWFDFAHPGPPGAGKGARAQALDFEGMISRQSLSRLVKKLKPAIHRYNRNSKYGPLTFFEVYTAIAFLYFKERRSGFAVLEAGLGGRLDATNAARASVCAITPVSYEHTQLLGSTLAKIAAEKAGIIKDPDSVVVSAPQEGEAAQVIRRRCGRIGAKLYEVGRDIKLKSLGGRFSVKAPFGDYRG